MGSCHDMVHRVAIWVLGCSGLLCRDRVPRQLRGLGHDRDFSVATETCWPRVATGNAVSR